MDVRQRLAGGLYSCSAPKGIRMAFNLKETLSCRNSIPRRSMPS